MKQAQQTFHVALSRGEVAILIDAHNRSGDGIRRAWLKGLLAAPSAQPVDPVDVTLLADCRDAFLRYQGDVDDLPTTEHKALMNRLDAVLAHPRPMMPDGMAAAIERIRDTMKLWAERDHLFVLDAANYRLVTFMEAVPKEETAAPLLRAMAANYSEGHNWDALDSDACLRAAEEIYALRTAVANARQVPDAKLPEADDHPDAGLYIKGWNDCREAMLAATPEMIAAPSADYAMPKGYGVDEFLPGIWQWTFDENGEETVSMTSYASKEYAVVAAWDQELAIETSARAEAGAILHRLVAELDAAEREGADHPMATMDVIACHEIALEAKAHLIEYPRAEHPADTCIAGNGEVQS